LKPGEKDCSFGAAGQECRAHVISALWQHFIASGRPKGASGSEGAGGPELVDLPAVAELPQLPTATEEQRVSSAPSRPRRRTSQAASSLSVALFAEPEPSIPAVAASPPATAAESARPGGAVVAAGASGEQVRMATSGARSPFATRHLEWGGLGLMLMIVALGGWWRRRGKKVTSAELARRRLRPLLETALSFL